ncbi:MAG: glycosyltransferase family 9 protein [Planctomycetota bacterium]
MSERTSLVVRAPNWVGDLVMSTPVLEAAIGSPLYSSVSILVREHLAGVLRDGPCEPQVVALARGDSEEAIYRRLAPRAALLLPNSFGSAWRAWRARVPVRAGSALSGRRCLLTHAVVPPTRAGRRLPMPTAHLQRDAAGLLGILMPDLHPRLHVREEVRSAVRAMLARLGLKAGAGYVACCPGAAFGAAKLWPPERFAEVLDGLHERRGWRGVVTGGPGEEALVEAVVQAAKHPAISLAREPRDLEQLKALVAESKLLLVGDSGPRWYAAAFDVPCVSVMGPNFPEVTATSLQLAAVARVEGLECSPCLQRRCPLGHHRCMNDLEPGRVLALALEVLSRPARTGTAA